MAIIREREMAERGVLQLLVGVALLVLKRRRLEAWDGKGGGNRGWVWSRHDGAGMGVLAFVGGDDNGWILETPLHSFLHIT